MVESVAGMRMNPDLGENSRIQLLAVPFSNTEASIELKFANRLTSPSAFHLMHFLKHLDGCAFETISIMIVTSIQHPNSMMTSISFPAAVYFTIHCRWLSFDNIPPLSTLKELTAFKPQGIECRADARQLEQAIQTIADYGQLPFSIALYTSCFDQQEFHAALQYFHTHDVRSTVSKVKIGASGFFNPIAWPVEPFDPDEAINSVEEQVGGKFVFIRVSEQSGKNYRAVVGVSQANITSRVTIEFDA